MIRWKVDKSILNKKKAKRNFLDVNRIRVRTNQRCFQEHLYEMENEKVFYCDALRQSMVILQ